MTNEQRQAARVEFVTRHGYTVETIEHDRDRTSIRFKRPADCVFGFVHWRRGQVERPFAKSAAFLGSTSRDLQLAYIERLP